jgi:hypothetical protein
MAHRATIQVADRSVIFLLILRPYQDFLGMVGMVIKDSPELG